MKKRRQILADIAADEDELAALKAEEHEKLVECKAAEDEMARIQLIKDFGEQDKEEADDLIEEAQEKGNQAEEMEREADIERTTAEESLEAAQGDLQDSQDAIEAKLQAIQSLKDQEVMEQLDFQTVEVELSLQYQPDRAVLAPKFHNSLMAPFPFLLLLQPHPPPIS